MVRKLLYVALVVLVAVAFVLVGLPCELAAGSDVEMFESHSEAWPDAEERLILPAASRAEHLLCLHEQTIVNLDHYGIAVGGRHVCGSSCSHREVARVGERLGRFAAGVLV